MKKIIALSIVSLFGSLLLIGCGSSNPSPEAHTGTVHSKHLTQEKVHDIILKAGKNDGWIMTKFKSNTLLAEKPDGDNSKSVVIVFDRHSFDITPPNSGLESEINDALGN